jgi:hypothetical protein
MAPPHSNIGQNENRAENYQASTDPLISTIELGELQQFLPQPINESVIKEQLPPQVSAHVSVIISYRDRAEHLKQLLPVLTEHLERLHSCYRIVVVEQGHSGLFNRGFLHNIGAIYCQDFTDGFVFHDVDFLPVNVDYRIYPAALRPFCKVTGAKTYTIPWYHRASVEDVLTPAPVEKGVLYTVYQNFFGGVTTVPKQVYEHINGYTNELWGWGLEDQDLLMRLKKSGHLTIALHQGHFVTLPHKHAFEVKPEARAHMEDVYNKNRAYFREQCAKPLNEHILSGINSMPSYQLKVNKEKSHDHLIVTFNN